jgi:hypothetical protein
MTAVNRDELLARADAYLRTINNLSNCGPHHLVSDLAAALRAASPAEQGTTVAIKREWMEHVVEEVVGGLQGNLPRGRIGDAVFLFRLSEQKGASND